MVSRQDNRSNTDYVRNRSILFSFFAEMEGLASMSAEQFSNSGVKVGPDSGVLLSYRIRGIRQSRPASKFAAPLSAIHRFPRLPSPTIAHELPPRTCVCNGFSDMTAPFSPVSRSDRRSMTVPRGHPALPRQLYGRPHSQIPYYREQCVQLSDARICARR
jgi:hypothetical protein